MDRRTFVRLSAASAAAGTVPFAASAAMAQVDRSNWQTAVAELRRIDNQIEAFDAAHYSPAGDMMGEVRARLPADPSGWSPDHRAVYNAAADVYDQAEKQFDRLASEQADAIYDLLLCPAPDPEAVRFKLQIAARQQVWECEWFGEVVDRMIEDLAGMNASALA